MKKFSKSDEDRLDQALARVVDYVEDGSSPTEALAKVAKEMNLPAGHIPLAARLYNIGRAETQFQSASDAVSRAAHFELADGAKAAAIVFPEQPDSPASRHKAMDISREYSSPPSSVLSSRTAKLAETARLAKAAARRFGCPKCGNMFGDDQLVAGPQGLCHDGCGGIISLSKSEQDRLLSGHIKQASKSGYVATFDPDISNKLLSLKPKTLHARVVFEDAVMKIGNTFKSASCPPLPSVRENAEFLFGPRGSHLFDIVVKHFPPSKEARLVILDDGLQADSTKSPYREIEKALHLGAVYNLLSEELSQVEKKANEQWQSQRQAYWDSTAYQNLGIGAGPVPPPELQARPPYQPSASEVEAEKRAGLGVLAGAAGTTMAHEMAGKLPSQKPLVILQAKALSSLTDPAHEQALRTIRVQAMLNDLLANDEVMSSYPPNEVTRHYNELSQLAPRVSEQEGPVRAFLRKRLQTGAYDPYEIDTLIRSERGLRDLSDTGESTNAPLIGAR